jgi:hypothetical protein
MSPNKLGIGHQFFLFHKGKSGSIDTVFNDTGIVDIGAIHQYLNIGNFPRLDPTTKFWRNNNNGTSSTSVERCVDRNVDRPRDRLKLLGRNKLGAVIATQFALIKILNQKGNIFGL